MLINIFNQYYKPLNNPPAKRLSAFAEYLIEKGEKVNVITGQPNYPSGKLKEGYNGIYKKEDIKGVSVYRFPEIPLEIKGAIKPLVNYFSFTLSSLFSIPILFKSKIIIFSSPPIFSIYLPFLITKLLKKKIILDIRDLWPDSLVGLGYLNKKSIIYKILNKLNIYLFNNSDRIITISKYLKNEIENKTKTEVHEITNFAKDNKLDLKYDKIKIVYLGRLTEVYNILDYIKVINKYDNIELHIIGDGELKSKIINEIKSNIKFYGYLEKEDFLSIIKECNIGLIPLKEMKQNREALPSKTFDYLSYGMPILFNTSLELKEYNEEYSFGWYVDNPTIENIEKVIRSIILDDVKIKSENAYKLFQEKFEESIVCEKLYNLIESL